MDETPATQRFPTPNPSDNPPAAQEHHTERAGCCDTGAAACDRAQHRASETERAQSVSYAVPGAAAAPVSAEYPAVVGFDIETTGIEDHDIVTVACVWSPTMQATCFHGDDFAPVLALLDAATIIHTYNGIEFDLPRLAKHCGRASIASWVRKTADPHYLMRHSMGFGGCLKLNELLLANGFAPKSGSGLQAIQFWHEGNREALSAYCMDDARLTYELCETRAGILWGDQWRIHLWEPCVMRFAGRE